MFRVLQFREEAVITVAPGFEALIATAETHHACWLHRLVPGRGAGFGDGGTKYALILFGGRVVMKTMPIARFLCSHLHLHLALLPLSLLPSSH